MKIIGIEKISVAELQTEVKNGGKFVIYQYCFSVVIMTFKRVSDIYFVKSNESRVAKGLSWSLLSFLFGWWGIPWGIVYTISALAKNFAGGKDVTAEVMRFIHSQTNGPVFDFETEVTKEEEKELDKLKPGLEN
jgi:hypothetical protein